MILAFWLGWPFWAWILIFGAGIVFLLQILGVFSSGGVIPPGGRTGPTFRVRTFLSGMRGWITTGAVKSIGSFLYPSLVVLGIVIVLIVIGYLVAGDAMKVLLGTKGFWGVVLAAILGALLLKKKWVGAYIGVLLLAIAAAVIFADQQNLAKASQAVTQVKETWKAATTQSGTTTSTTQVVTPTPAVKPVATGEIPVAYGMKVVYACPVEKGATPKFPADYPPKYDADGSPTMEPERHDLVGKYWITWGTFDQRDRDHVRVIPNGDMRYSRIMSDKDSKFIDASNFRFQATLGQPVKMYVLYGLRGKSIDEIARDPDFLEFLAKNVGPD